MEYEDSSMQRDNFTAVLIKNTFGRGLHCACHCFYGCRTQMLEVMVGGRIMHTLSWQIYRRRAAPALEERVLLTSGLPQPSYTCHWPGHSCRSSRSCRSRGIIVAAAVIYLSLARPSLVPSFAYLPPSHWLPLCFVIF